MVNEHNIEVPKEFVLKSTDISTVFNLENFGYSAKPDACKGGNKSPQLSWENAPIGTKSFAVTMIDIHAFGPNIPFNHWILINIPPSTNSLVKDAGNISGQNLPSGARLMPYGAYPDYVENPEVVRAYAGVCPNIGNTNYYEITVYALTVDKLNVSDTATSNEVITAIQDTTISSVKLSITASR